MKELRRLWEAERKLTIEVAISEAAVPRKGASDPAAEAAEVRVETGHPLKVICRVLGAPRSTVYARRHGQQPDHYPSRAGDGHHR